MNFSKFQQDERHHFYNKEILFDNPCPKRLGNLLLASLARSLLHVVSPSAPPPPAGAAPPSPRPTPPPSRSSDRGALLGSIEGFKKGKLKKTVTNDRSGPLIRR